MGEGTGAPRELSCSICGSEGRLPGCVYSENWTKVHIHVCTHVYIDTQCVYVKLQKYIYTHAC